jgi:predicted Zn-dependent protease
MKIIEMKKLIALLIILISIVIWESCSTVPVLGRKQLNLLPESQMVSLGLTNYKTFLDSSEVITTGKDVQMVKEVGKNISAAVVKFLNQNGLSDRVSSLNWEFNLVNDKTVNAWCMPGGKVVFYSGIIPTCEDVQGIAVVMGHEIAHAVARHGNERMSESLIAQYGSVALDMALQKEPAKTKSIYMNAYGIGAQYGLILPFSRKQEYEADKLGLIFMTMAGYDPNEAITFWQRMKASESTQMPEFLSTHPLSDKRIEALKRAIPEMAVYKPGK